MDKYCEMVKKEPTETTQQQQGQVSAQATEPKDEKQTAFTEEEIQLAERYKVEPKTCRLISEIVSVHTEEILNLINVMKGRQEKQVEPEKAIEDGRQTIYN